MPPMDDHIPGWPCASGPATSRSWPAISSRNTLPPTACPRCSPAAGDGPTSTMWRPGPTPARAGCRFVRRVLRLGALAQIDDRNPHLAGMCVSEHRAATALALDQTGRHGHVFSGPWQQPVRGLRRPNTARRTTCSCHGCCVRWRTDVRPCSGHTASRRSAHRPWARHVESNATRNAFASYRPGGSAPQRPGIWSPA
jgi:hypothetical protein